MSPTVPTTADPPDSWIQLGPSSLPSSTDAMANLIRVDQSTRQRCEDGLKGNKIADAYGRPLDIVHDNGEENNGNCWLLTHHGVSSLSLNGNWQRQDYHEPMTIDTAEFWIHQLRSALNETRSNLNLIVAFHHRQMQKRSQPSSDLNAKPPGTVMLSKSVAVQTSNDMNNESKEEVIDESKLNCYRKPIATLDLHSRSDCSIILPAPPAVTSKPKASTVLLDGCRFSSNSCCFHGAYETPERQTMSSSRRDDCKKRKSHDHQWNQNVDTTTLLLNNAWQLAGLHTRQRMAILSRHYRILYQRHRRLRKRYRHLRRSMRRTCHQSRYIQHQFQILLKSIVSQVDEVASDWVDRLKGLLDNATADPSSSDYSYSPLDFTTRSSLAAKASEQLKSSPTSSSFSLYRWYSSLSLKLSWIQTSHRNVIDNIVLFQRIARDV